MALNVKQARFVAEYLKDLNGTQAAVRAGYSAKTARQIGSRLLTQVDVAAAIEAGQTKKLDRLELSAEKVLSDIIRLSKAAESTGELSTALKGQELLGKHLKLFTDKVEHSGALTLEQLVLASKGGSK